MLSSSALDGAEISKTHFWLLLVVPRLLGPWARKNDDNMEGIGNQVLFLTAERMKQNKTEVHPQSQSVSLPKAHFMPKK